MSINTPLINQTQKLAGALQQNIRSTIEQTVNYHLEDVCDDNVLTQGHSSTRDNLKDSIAQKITSVYLTELFEHINLDLYAENVHKEASTFLQSLTQKSDRE